MNECSKVPAIDKMDKIFTYLYYKYYATQAEISKDLNLPKATVNRLLSVLTKLQYLAYKDKKYSIGEKFYFFSNKIEKYTLIKNITYPYLEELSLRFKETFKLSVLDEDKIRTVAKVESNDILKISVDENAIFPLHAGAASKLLICQLNDLKLNKLLSQPLPKYTKNTITNMEMLKSQLLKINIQKIAFDNMEYSKDIKAVAIPILDKSNRIIAAISCPYFSTSVIEQDLPSLIREIKKTCCEISKRLKYFEGE